MMLELQDLHVAYGGIRALKGVSLQVGEGEIVTLIGANGAGKSTTLRTISGLEHAQAGKILYNGVDITGKPSKYMVQEGLILVPEGRLIFPDMTVLENLRIGAYLRKDRSVEKDIDRMYELFPRLKERSWQMAGTLSGGEQQMLAVGRADEQAQAFDDGRTLPWPCAAGGEGYFLHYPHHPRFRRNRAFD